MTTTNQAFIKAYRQDAPQAHFVGPQIKGDARPTGGVPGTHVDYVTVGAAHFAASYDTRTASNLLEAQTPSSLPTPKREGLGANSTIWPTCEAPFGRIDKPSAVGKLPLSAYTAQRFAAQNESSGVERGSGPQPATTVASFSWPAVCRTLCQRCARDFDGVVDLLAQHRDKGRSIVGVIGLFRGVGTTTTLLCLAARLAARGRRARARGRRSRPVRRRCRRA